MELKSKEYTEAVRGFHNSMEEKIFVDAEADEFYYVENVFREDIKDAEDNKYGFAFRKVGNIKKMIERINDNLVDFGTFDYLDEELCEFMWWNIDKYRIIDDEYERVITIRMHAYGEITDIYFARKYDEESNLG